VHRPRTSQPPPVQPPTHLASHRSCPPPVRCRRRRGPFRTPGKGRGAEGSGAVVQARGRGAFRGAARLLRAFLRPCFLPPLRLGRRTAPPQPYPPLISGSPTGLAPPTGTGPRPGPVEDPEISDPTTPPAAATAASSRTTGEAG